VELRIHRTFAWTRAPYGPGEPVTYGGPPRPFVLEHTDTLQLRSGDGNWAVVPVVEGERPPKPEPARRHFDFQQFPALPEGSP
jgi:hypothetical protein